MSVKVRWRKLVGRRTNIKCKFPGKEAYRKKEHRKERKNCQNMYSAEHISSNCNERKQILKSQKPLKGQTFKMDVDKI